MATDKTYAYLTTRIEHASKVRAKLIAQAKDITMSKLLAMYIEEGLTKDSDVVNKYVTQKYQEFIKDNSND
jgi:hypothetical protein